MPAVKGLLESALFVADVDRAGEFYETVMGLRRIVHDERGCVFVVTDRQLLLLIKQGVASRPNVTPGGVIPPCDATGTSHIAFAVDRDDLDGWRRKLREHGVEIASEVDFERGGRSLYLRDPDGHLVELATPGIWEVY